MAFMDKKMKIEGVKNLYLSDTMNLGKEIITEDDYKTLLKSPRLTFSVDIIIKKKRYRHTFEPIKGLGRKDFKDYVLADAILLREQLILDINSGEYQRKKDEIQKQKESLKAKESKLTFGQEWEKYTSLRVLTRNMKPTYKYNNTLFFNKHMGTLTENQINEMCARIKKVTIAKYKDNKTIKKEQIDKEIAEHIKHFKSLRRIANLKLEEITREDFQNLIVHMENAGYAPATTAQLSRAFSIIFTNALSKGEITVSPFQGLVFTTINNERDFKLNKKDSAKLYNKMMNYPIYTYRGIFMFLLEGRRMSEVLDLTWDRVDLKKKEYWYTAHQNKSGKPKKYKLPDNIVELLKLLPYQRTGFVFKSTRATKENGNQAGGRIYRFDKRWKSILKDLDIKQDIHIHDIRHWIGNTIINNGGTLEAISFVLGQESIQSAKRYSKQSEETGQETVQSKFHDKIKNLEEA